MATFFTTDRLALAARTGLNVNRPLQQPVFRASPDLLKRHSKRFFKDFVFKSPARKKKKKEKKKKKKKKKKKEKSAKNGR